MKNFKTISLFILVSTLLISCGLYATETEYEDLLHKYTTEGHLSDDEAQTQALRLKADAKNHETFNKKVRSIASTLSNNNQIVIKLENKPITINVKRETSEKRRVRKIHP